MIYNISPKLSEARGLPQTYRQTVPQTRPCKSNASITKSVVGSWNCRGTVVEDEMSVSSGSVGGRGHQNVNSNSDFRDSSPVASCRSMNIIDECRCVIEFLWQMPWASGISSNRGNAINFRAIRSQAGWICYSSRLTSGGGCGGVT